MRGEAYATKESNVEREDSGQHTQPYVCVIWCHFYIGARVGMGSGRKSACLLRQGTASCTGSLCGISFACLKTVKTLRSSRNLGDFDSRAQNRTLRTDFQEFAAAYQNKRAEGASRIRLASCSSLGAVRLLVVATDGQRWLTNARTALLCLAAPFKVPCAVR